MKKILISNFCGHPVFFASLIAALAVSCSKKEDTAAVPVAPPQDAPVAEQPVAAQAAAPQQVEAAAQPIQDAPPQVMVSEAQAAIKAKNFERAQAILQSNPRTPVPMTGEQLMARNQAIGDLYKQASAAAAAGDPRAKAVLEKMKRDAEHR